MLDPDGTSWLLPAVKNHGRRALLAIVVTLCASTGVALATRSGDDRARAQSMLSEIERVPAHATLAREAVAEAKHALARADEARAANDTTHAPELDALGREWAETGTDLVRAAEAEKKLSDTQRELTRIETQATRARALLEETVGRRGRAQAKLEELEKQGATGAKVEPPTPKPEAPKPATKPAPQKPSLPLQAPPAPAPKPKGAP